MIQRMRKDMLPWSLAQDSAGPNSTAGAMSEAPACPAATSAGTTDQPCPKSRHLESVLLHANRQVVCCKGHTSLHHLVKYGNLQNTQMLQSLLASSADPFCADKSGRTALDYALQQYNEPIGLMGSLRPALQQLLDRAIFGTSAEVKLNRSFGMGRHWRRLYCALIPFSPEAGSAPTDLQLMLIDEATLCRIDTISVTACKAFSSRASSADKMRISLEITHDDKLKKACAEVSGVNSMQLKLQAINESSRESTRLQQLVTLAQLNPGKAVQWAEEMRAKATASSSSVSQADFYVLPRQPRLDKTSAMEVSAMNSPEEALLSRVYNAPDSMHHQLRSGQVLQDVLKIPAGSSMKHIQKLERHSAME